MKESPTLVIYGAGAIGSCIAGWLAPYCPQIYLLARGSRAEFLERENLQIFQNIPTNKETISIKVIRSLAECPEADIIVVTVKNYDLDTVAKDIQHYYHNRPIVVGLQNGLENQQILPKYFTKVVFGILWFGAWLENSGEVGYKHKGPISLGIIASTPELKNSLDLILKIFQLGFTTEIAFPFQDAVRSKMILNLTNSLMTLIGHGYRPITDIDKLRRITTGLLNEGIHLIQAARFTEYVRGSNPSWKLLQISEKLPGFISNAIFKGDLKNLALNSMAQDLLLHHKSTTELESLNGYFIQLADQYQQTVPYNRVIYSLCKEEFSKIPFQPMTETEIWHHIQSYQSKNMR